MPGHHKEDSELANIPLAAKIGAGALVGVLLIGGGILAIASVTGGCGDVATYTVAVDPTMAPVVATVVDATSESDLGCSAFTVTAADPAETLTAVAKGQDGPALWIPDSTLWLAKAGKATGTLVDVAGNSVASTPAVIVARKGEAPQFSTWLSALQSPGMRVGNPLASSVSSAPLIGALAEAEAGTVEPGAVSATLASMAQAQQAGAQEMVESGRMDAVFADGGNAVVTEQQALKYGVGVVSSTVPSSGSVFLNYPLAVTERAGSRHEAAKSAGVALAEAMESEAGRAALSDAAFRTPDLAPLSRDRGVGQVSALTVSDQAAVAAALQRYAVLALPSRALVVEDVSGSMAAQAGGETRMALTVQASAAGLRLFPENAQIGLWAFSTGLDGDKDYRQLVPIRGLSESVGGLAQRQVLADSIGALPTMIGGSTGLYDTTLAAFREVKAGYDPDAINSVILLTDGANEDPGSISLEALLATLREEQDPSKPVIIVTIGITEDADASVLQQIATATGGTSYVARNPAEIPNVFVKAIASRAG